ncbi:putative Zinc finger, BED-type [Corchorus capsularis]|uniref:Putative Zinc finger, BED-type n=1 Tax=Corchorus capsularis TaxID=210143 RepID=A0A1R3G0I5_COCAP|nr:putative Zinc finger, BED-type [Corchorus capsularis]
MPKDDARQHGTPILEIKGGVICKYCGFVMRSGGVTRLKWHLAGIDPKKNVKACEVVTDDVRDLMQHSLCTFAKSKEKRRTHMDDIRAELATDVMGQEDNVEDEDEDTVAYPPDVSADKMHAYKKAFHASKQFEWEWEQRMRYSSGPGDSSGQSSKSGNMLQRSHTVREKGDPVTKAASVQKSGQSTH